MKATITYQVKNLRHPWDERRANRGEHAWCLVKVTTPEYGLSTHEAVAIFNLDSEAEIFMGHIFAAGLNGNLVTIDEGMKDFFELMRKRSG